MAPSTRTKRDGVPGTRIILLFFSSDFQVQVSPGFFICLQSSIYPTTTYFIGFRITRLSFSWDSGPRRPRPFNSVITTTSCRGPGTHKYLRLFSCFDCCFRCCYYCVFQARQNPLSQESCPIAGTYLGHLPDAPGLCARLVSNCKNRWELSSSLLSLLLLSSSSLSSTYLSLLLLLFSISLLLISWPGSCPTVKIVASGKVDTEWGSRLQAEDVLHRLWLWQQHQHIWRCCPCVSIIFCVHLSALSHLSHFLGIPYLSKVSCFVAFIANFPPIRYSEIILLIDRRPSFPTCDRRWKAVDWWNPPNPPPGQDPPDPPTRGSAQSLPSWPDLRSQQPVDPKEVVVANLNIDIPAA